MCSTTPKTKAASPAVTDPVKIKKQVGTLGGGGGSTAPPPLKFDGAQEHIPDLTFIIEPRLPNDDYLASATAYHTNCGLQPQQIHSIDHLVSLLTAATTPLKRIRVVGHASGEDLIIPLFGQTNVRDDRHALKENLNDFAISDERGLLGLFSLVPGQYFTAWVMTDILTMIRGSNSALLNPFGIKTSGSPSTDELKKFILYCCDYAFVSLNFYKKNNNSLTADEKAGMLKAYSALIGIKAKAIRDTKYGTHTVTAGELQSLRDDLTQRTANDLNLGAGDVKSYTFNAGDVNPFLLGGRAGDAVAAGFRDNLEKVRKRFSTDSVIDIRGCRAGNITDYLRAIQDFFAQSTAKPTVTAPLWYQAFAATNSYSHPQNITEIHALLQNGASAPGIRAGFATWSTMSSVDSAHKQPWSDILDGSAVKFVLPDWRKNLPALPIATPGLTAYLAMNFIDFINKTRDFFNLAAGNMPSAAALTTINTFITSKLTGYAINLLAVTDGGTAQNKLNNILTALNTINTDLGNVVSPVPAAPISFVDLTEYQKKLVKFIDDNKIADIKPFMTALKTRINDANDPGFYYYMLFSGMPVFVFSDHEIVNDHMVNVQNNRLVLLNAFADQAYRQWPQLSWAEPLPAGNNFPTMHPGDFASRRSMMMVELPTGGNSRAAVCPNKDYLNHVTSV